MSLAQIDNSSISTLFPALGDLARWPPPVAGLGSHQNLTYCCLEAVNYAFEYSDGELTYTDQDQVQINTGWNDERRATPEEFIRASENGQFPCTAAYVKDDRYGAPQVQVTYKYCQNTCGKGWVRSTASPIGAWVSAFVGFILPSIVFALSIPRRRKLRISNKLFGQRFNTFEGFILTLLGFVVAAVLAALDVILWLSTCFAFSGPMLLAAAHESFLDNRVVNFLKQSVELPGGGEPGLTSDMRARLLFIVLVANLDLQKRDLQVITNPPETGQSRFLSATSPFYHIETTIWNLRLYGSLHGDSCHPEQKLEQQDVRNQTAQERINRSNERKACMKMTKTRLRAMLECQYSFGATIGAPIVFFVGAFVYTLLETLAELGNETHSLSLAFGMWWMMIPEIAVLSGLLLAGNNPNTLEGVLAQEAQSEFPLSNDRDAVYLPLAWISPKIPLKLQLAYPSCYKIQWLWARGRNKQAWLTKVCEIYAKHNYPQANSVAATANQPPVKEENDQIKQLRIQTTPALADLLKMASLAVFLLTCPSVLAFLTAYFTPTVGLACRSLTFTVYLSVQLCMVLLYLPISFYTTDSSKSPSLLQRLLSALRMILIVTLSALAVFTSIGGTLMQLMGVYSQCTCNVSAWYWSDMANPAVWIEIGNNSAIDIEQASRFWTPLALTALCYLAFITYYGWWWQRRLRDEFHYIVQNLDHNAFGLS